MAGCVADPFATLPNASQKGVCYKNSLNGFPYWYECQGKKVTQTISNSSSSIENFTVFPEEQRIFFELDDAKGKNFYSNNFLGNSLTLLNLRPNKGSGEAIEYFSVGKTNFLDILKGQKRLVYRLVEKNQLGQVSSEMVFSNSLYGDSQKELAPKSSGLEKTECLGFEGDKLFWIFSKKDSKGEESHALYYNGIDGKGIVLASQVAKTCNPNAPAQRSSTITNIERNCADNAFFSKGNFAFWIFRDIWNSNECNASSTIEAVYATYLPSGRIKVLTQFAELEKGDYLQLSKENIDIVGNRFVWIYYSRDSDQLALYYNCLKGAGEPRIIDNSLGNVPEDAKVKIEKNTVSWQANGKQFSAELQECPN
ncbi:MAG: hypothetical protein PHD95_07145 [Candidatus ainarchaeum sp.]|nr:hypothetical protein [Candidatus ainarchaeum sp.]